jgi:transposase-like protein
MARPIICRPSKDELDKLYRVESRSIRNIAEILGCSKDVIFRALKEYEIERRRKTERRSQLKDYDFSYLETEVKKKGLSQVSREIGVHKSTLMRFLRKENS